MHREESGDLTFDLENSALTDAYRSTQSGWYLQGVFQFRPRWRAGLRYDSLDSGNPRDRARHERRAARGCVPIAAARRIQRAPP